MQYNMHFQHHRFQPLLLLRNCDNLRLFGAKTLLLSNKRTHPVNLAACKNCVTAVRSLGKGGGLGMGLTTPSGKKTVTETNTKDQANCGNRNEASQETGRMKDASQTHMEADRPMVDFLKPKKKMRVICWNVRTLYQTGKLAQVVRGFDNYNLDILGISEVDKNREQKE